MPIVFPCAVLQIINAAGGVMGAVMLNAIFKASGLMALANGKMRFMRFYGSRYDGTHHILTWQGADQ